MNILIEQERIENYNLSKSIFIKTNDTDQENKINVFKSFLKSSISTKDYEMIKRERSIMIQIKIKDFQNLFMHIKIHYIYIWKYHLLKD